MRGHALSNALALSSALGVLLTAAPAPWPPVATPAAGPSSQTWAHSRVTRILEAFHHKLPSLRALDFYVTSVDARLHVLNAVTPSNLDEYDYENGTIVGPLADRWNDSWRESAQRGHVLDWDTVSRAGKLIPQLVPRALARLGLEGGLVDVVILHWDPLDPAPHLRVFVKGSRKDGILRADLRGNVQSVVVSD